MKVTKKSSKKPVSATASKKAAPAALPSPAESPVVAQIRDAMKRSDKIDRAAKRLKIDREKAASSLCKAGMALVAVHEFADQMGIEGMSLCHSSVAICLEAISEQALREIDAGMDALGASSRAGFFEEATGTESEAAHG